MFIWLGVTHSTARATFYLPIFFSLNVVSITTLAKTAAAAAESLWQSFTHHNHQQQARNKYDLQHPTQLLQRVLYNVISICMFNVLYI